ncbi:MAG TPA: hypothetical protein VMK12_14190 [Anaeromyxobacteraceae bacterium]|nr:hypothetical protein [Anaeromyxobacteraceae bacterium]
MNKLLLSVALGIGAGIVDIIPMIPIGAGRYAVASAFVHWVVLGFVITHVQLGIARWLVGLLVALLSAAPIAILVAEKDPEAVLPIAAMSSLLGVLIGHLSGRIAERPARNSSPS